MQVLRFGVEFVEEATAVLFVEDAGEAPWLVLHGLDVHDLDDEDVARLGGFDLEGPGQVVDLGQVDVLHVVCAVVVADLSTGPVKTFDLDRLAVFDGACEWDCWSQYRRRWAGLEVLLSGCHLFYTPVSFSRKRGRPLTKLTCRWGCSAASLLRSTLAAYLISDLPMLKSWGL